MADGALGSAVFVDVGLGSNVTEVVVEFGCFVVDGVSDELVVESWFGVDALGRVVSGVESDDDVFVVATVSPCVVLVEATESFESFVASAPPLVGVSVETDSVDVVASAGVGPLPAAVFVGVLSPDVELPPDDVAALVDVARTFTSVDAAPDSGDAPFAAAVDSAVGDEADEEPAAVVAGTAAVEVLAWLAVLTGTSEVPLLALESAAVAGASVVTVFDEVAVASPAVVALVALPVELELLATSVEAVWVLVALAVASCFAPPAGVVSELEAVSEDECAFALVELAVFALAEVELVSVDPAAGVLFADSVEVFAAVEALTEVDVWAAVSPLDAFAVEACCSSLFAAVVEPVWVVAPADAVFSLPPEAEPVAVVLVSVADPFDAAPELLDVALDSFAPEVEPLLVDSAFELVAPVAEAEEDVVDLVLVVPELDELFAMVAWELVPPLVVATRGWNTTVEAAPIAVFAA